MLEEQERGAERPTKKKQILDLFLSGAGEIEEIARRAECKPSYVASVLQESGMITGYFDLYTPHALPMNVYSKAFQGRLGFKNLDSARRSVELIERHYRQHETSRDRAGQHHALSVALEMYDRARWTGKADEAEVFRRWLLDRLEESA